MEGDAESGCRGEPEARVVLGVAEDDGERLTPVGRLGQQRLDDGGADAGALMLGLDRTGGEAGSGDLTDEAAGEHGVGDDLTVEDADERESFDPVAGSAESVDDLRLVHLAEGGRGQCVDGVDVIGRLGADGELGRGRIRHPHTIAIIGAASARFTVGTAAVPSALIT